MKINTKYGQALLLSSCPLLDSTEDIEFLTEVHEYITGDEYRAVLREIPRQILSFNYVAMRKAMGDMFHELYSNLRGLWAVSLRQCVQQVGNVSGDFIECRTSVDLHIGYALLFNNTESQVVEITEIGQGEVDGVVLSDAVEMDNAHLVPLRICMIDGDVSWAAGGFYARQNIRFLVLAEDGPTFNATAPEQYELNDIYFTPLIKASGELDMTLSQHQVIVDGEVGRFVQFTDHAKPRYLKPFISVLKNQNEFFDYKEFAFRRQGKFRPFWQPLFEAHLNIMSVGLNWIEVDNSSVIEAGRGYIALKIGGIWQPYKITSKTQMAGKVRLTLNQIIGVLVEQIQYCCYLGLYRFAADTIHFEFLGSRVVKTTVPIVELKS